MSEGPNNFCRRLHVCLDDKGWNRNQSKWAVPCFPKHIFRVTHKTWTIIFKPSSKELSNIYLQILHIFADSWWLWQVNIFTILKLKHKKNTFVHFLQSTEVNNVQPTCTSWFSCKGELWYSKAVVVPIPHWYSNHFSICRLLKKLQDVLRPQWLCCKNHPSLPLQECTFHPGFLHTCLPRQVRNIATYPYLPRGSVQCNEWF